MKLDGIMPCDISRSVAIKDNIHNIFDSKEGLGRSGSFFFFSADKQYIVKTMRGSEKKVLLNMLDDLVNHYHETNNLSLLARIYGIFTIKTNKFASVDVLIMANSARTTKGTQKMAFDLKGSTKHREVIFDGKATKWWRKTKACPESVMKDVNFKYINQEFNDGLLSFGPLEIEHFNQIVRKDSEFLKKYNLMDYSLLFIIEHSQSPIPKITPKPKFERGVINSENILAPTFSEQTEKVHQRYHIAIIDYLQEYNLNKKMERFAKTTCRSKSKRDKVSCAPTAFYQERFVEFVRTSIFTRE